MNRTATSDLQQRRRNTERRSKSTAAVEFFNVLTSAELLQTTEAVLPEHRERLYPPTVTLSMFMRQVLEADGSCQKAVNGWAAQRAADGLRACSVRTGGYCRARQRLPLEMVSALTRQTGRLLSQKARPQWLWRGRAVKLVDGTGLSMPDTPQNQAMYPQPSTQAPGVGFPLARLVLVICLATGAALDAAIGPHQGKGSGDLIEVEMVIDSKNDYEYLMLEDHKPSGFEPDDQRSGYVWEGLRAYRELRDDRVSFFLTTLARGQHSISYRMRAETPGFVSALPATIEGMYAPELVGNSDEMKLKVVDNE